MSLRPLWSNMKKPIHNVKFTPGTAKSTKPTANRCACRADRRAASLGFVCTSKEIIDRAGELFDQAEAAVADDPVLLKRVRKERLGIELVRISSPAEFLPTWQAFEQAVDTFARVAGEWDIENIREGGSMDRQLKTWQAEARQTLR